MRELGPGALVWSALKNCTGLAPEKPQETLSWAKFSSTRCCGRRSQEAPSDYAIPGEGHWQDRSRNQTPKVLRTRGHQAP